MCLSELNVALVLVCVGRPLLHTQPTTIPCSHWSRPTSTRSVEGGESRGEKGMTGTQVCFHSLHKTLSLFYFSSHSFNTSLFPFLFLPSFSSLLWLSTQIPTGWDKEREKARERQRKREREGERWEVMGCKCFVTWPLGAKGDNLVCVCLRLCFSVSVSVSMCGYACLFTFLLTVQ